MGRGERHRAAGSRPVRQHMVILDKQRGFRALWFMVVGVWMCVCAWFQGDGVPHAAGSRSITMVRQHGGVLDKQH